MAGKVSALSIIFMVVSCIAGFAIPVILFVFFRKKKKADILPFFVGLGVMLVFSLILEAIVHQIVLGSPVGDKIKSSIWLYALYGGMMAGLFEETGRFLAFKTVLRKKNDNDINALMYGAGHGGFEAAYLLGQSMFNNIVFAILINSGSIFSITDRLSGDALTQMEATIEAMVTTPSYSFLIGIMERLFAVVLQIALSVIVWFAAKNSKKWYLYPAAIIIHFTVDAVAVVLSQYQVPILAIEAVICIMAVLAVLFARMLWDKYSVSADLDEPE